MHTAHTALHIIGLCHLTHMANSHCKYIVTVLSLCWHIYPALVHIHII